MYEALQRPQVRLNMTLPQAGDSRRVMLYQRKALRRVLSMALVELPTLLMPLASSVTVSLRALLVNSTSHPRLDA